LREIIPDTDLLDCARAVGLVVDDAYHRIFKRSLPCIPCR
jgi:hypothetical protein